MGRTRTAGALSPAVSTPSGGGTPASGGLVRAASFGHHLGTRADALEGGGGDSMFAVAMESMEEVLRVGMPISLDALQESFGGFDCDSSRFGQMLCRRLGYMGVAPTSWQGNESDGMRREVRMTVKCPPKPMLPDTTRVHIKHRLQRRPRGGILLERELWTLDVPYGETFCVQERWLATPDAASPSAAADGEAAAAASCELSVHAHVFFKSKGLLATKIRTHALKKSRKCAALAAELLLHAGAPVAEYADDDEAAGGAGSRRDSGGAGQSEALRRLREEYETLLEEAQFHKNRANQLERENKRLSDQQKYTRKSKKELTQKLVDLENTLQRERRERAAMEEALTEAYSQTLRDMVAQQEMAATQRSAPAAGSNRRGSLGLKQHHLR